MSNYYGDFLKGQTVRVRFNTVSSAGVPTTLTSGAVLVSKDGSDMTGTPPTGVTLSVDAGSVTGRHHVVIDTSANTDFTAGSEYAVRLSGSSAVAGTSVVGVNVGEFSIANRSVAVDATGRAKIQAGLTRNTALTGFEFYLPLSQDGKSPATGKAPPDLAGKRSIDGGTWAAITNTALIEEVSSVTAPGFYKVDLSQADLNGTTIKLVFSATGCDQQIFDLITTP